MDNIKDVDDYNSLLNILNFWFDNNPEATWEQLATALEECGYKRIAENIRKANSYQRKGI